VGGKVGDKVGSKADGKGKATYYIAGDALSAEPNVLSTEAVSTPLLGNNGVRNHFFNT
jgi:hypothetical protein